MFEKLACRLVLTTKIKSICATNCEFLHKANTPSNKAAKIRLCRERRQRGFLGKPGSPNTLFGSPRFRRILVLGLWCRPTQISHWLPHTPHFTSLAPALMPLWRRPCTMSLRGKSVGRMQLFLQFLTLAGTGGGAVHSHEFFF